ncbi:MAG TPA: plasmid pRiA4b ORF-3 family protein [Planctomycetaceae bacterium]|nr:plasmid pRiA4b ORF-3 family protein [Planctomycetaceae bacterium]
MPRKPFANKFSHIDPEVLKSLIAGTPEEIEQALQAMAEGGQSAVVSADDLLPAIPIPPDAVFEVKMTLSGFRPAVTRTIAVCDMSLGDLHFAIQIAMGWTNSHMHEFEVQGTDRRFGEIPDASDSMAMDFGMDVEWDDEEGVNLSQLVAADRRRLTYTYDFGDSWTHEILISKPKVAKPALTYPCCLKGVLACPPEDCGGIWGYLDLVDSLRIPAAERSDDQRERLEWLGRFDPDKFDSTKVTKQLQKAFPPRKAKSGARKQPSKRSVKPKR